MLELEKFLRELQGLCRKFRVRLEVHLTGDYRLRILASRPHEHGDAPNRQVFTSVDGHALNGHEWVI